MRAERRSILELKKLLEGKLATSAPLSGCNNYDMMFIVHFGVEYMNSGFGLQFWMNCRKNTVETCCLKF